MVKPMGTVCRPPIVAKSGYLFVYMRIRIIRNFVDLYQYAKRKRVTGGKKEKGQKRRGERARPRNVRCEQGLFVCFSV